MKTSEMDICDQEDAKLACIRQTIRRVVLPLVQAIYEEDPSDTISFCSRYFENLLQDRDNKRENEFSSMKDSSEKDLTRNDKKNEESSSPPLQGSASDPLLSSQVLSEKLKLRETSSWDSPANKPATAKFRKNVSCSLADATSRIGDQPSAEVFQTGIEGDVKAGDIQPVILDDKTFDDDRHFEIQPNQSIETNSPEDKIRMPSAPPYEDVEHTYSKKELSITANNNILAEENKTEKHSKPLSPNTSLGFIPQLNEQEKDKEAEKRDYDYSNNEDSNNEDLNRDIKYETENPPASISDTFYGLAQKFDCAETNFNSEFQNAKEISDVIQGQHDSEINSRYPEERDNNIHKKNDGDKDTKNDDDSTEFYDINEDTDIKKEVCTSTALNNLRSDDYYQKEKYDNGQKKITDCFKSEYGTAGKRKFHARERGESSPAGDDNNDGDKEQSSEPRPVVDETWRKRWYEVHPHLGNFSPSEPTLHRTYGIFTNKSSLKKVGEGGDVPPDRFTIRERASNEDLNSNLEPHENISQSSDIQYKASQDKFYPDDEKHKADSKNTHDNTPKLDIPTETSPSVQFQHIPYSWRNRWCKPQVCSPGNERLHGKEVRMKSTEGTIDSKTSCKELSNTIMSDSETSCKITLNKESEKEIANEGKDGSLDTSLKIGECEENACKIIQDKRSPEKEITGVNVSNDDEFSSVPSHFQASSKGNNKSESKEEASILNNKIIGEGCDFQKQTEVLGSSTASGRSNESNTEGFMKVEPELNSPYGDSVSCENINEDLSLQVQRESSDESYQDIDVITAEHLEEVIQRVVEQQNESQDSDYEGLNFSSDSSRVDTSDFSESDDFSFANSFSEK